MSIKMHIIDSRFVTGPSNTRFVCVYVRAFQPGKLTGWGNEGVKLVIAYLVFERGLRKSQQVGQKTRTGCTPLKQIELRLSVRVQELCESRGGHPGLSVLTSLLASVDVKLY